MGLTIHYTLKAKSRSVTKARQLVESLHSRALDLPFKEVGAVFELTGDACDFQNCADDDPHRWLLIQGSGHIQRGPRSYTVAPKHVIGFTTLPGDGCEEANFGLCRYPAAIEIEDRATWPYRQRILRTGLTGWRWGAFCKTQYASVNGIQSFLRCHLLVVRLLDHCTEIGLETDVNDEGGYWKKRDVQALAKEVGDWNQMIAAVVGEWKDLLGPGQDAVAPITSFPDFEHLEAKGRDVA
jgi:hypothetical protein